MDRELSARFELSDPVAPLPDLVAADDASLTADPPPGMSLSDLEQWALQYHPTLAESAALMDAGRWNRLQVGLPPNPTIGYLGVEIGNEGRAGQQGGYVEQKFIRGGKLLLNRAVAQHEVERLQHQFSARQWRVLTDVRIAFYELLALQERVLMLQRMEEINRQAADTARQLFQARESPKTDYLLARIQWERVRLDRQATEKECLGASRQLAARVGVDRLPSDRVAGDLETLAPDLDWDNVVSSLLVTHPLVAAAQADVRRARRAVDRARAQVVPDLTTQLALQRDTATGDTIVGVMAGLNVPVWNRNRGAIGQACAELRAAQQHVQHVELQLRERLATVYADYQAARLQVQRYHDEILPQAGETQRLVAQGYQQEELSFLEYLTAQLTFFQSSVRYLDALRDYWTNYQRVTGLLLDNNLQTPP